MKNLTLQIRAAWLTAKRAGLRRTSYRIQRRIRLRLLDPRFAQRWYPQPSISSSPPPLPAAVVDLLTYILRLRGAAHTGHDREAWDRNDQSLILLNQPPISLRLPVDWTARPSSDPLWAFQLHGWEWAWSALSNATDDHATNSQLHHLMQDWIGQHPIGKNASGKGIAWEPYPTSRRLIVWSAAWVVLGQPTDLAASILQQAAYLADHLERDLDNNHLIANAKALAWVGILLQGLPSAGQWRTLGLSLIWEALDAQVNEDGGHEENSSGYHLAVWLDGLETALLAQASREPPPESIWHHLEKMGEFALALRRPDGRLPLLNDSNQDEPMPLQLIFALAADLFDREDFAWAAGREEARPPMLAAQGFADTGYAVLRAGSKPETEIYLLFDAGNLGPTHCPGHGHADALSIELWSQGQPILLDPGTYQYPSGQWRDYFRSTAAHSTATVDGQNQSVFAGPFRIAEMATARLTSVTTQTGLLEAEGEHDGYLRLKEPVSHKRRVRLHGEDLLTIQDTFEDPTSPTDPSPHAQSVGEEQPEHEIAIYFHLAPSQVSIQNKSNATVNFARGVSVNFAISSSAKGELTIEEGWSSREWYRKEESPVLVYRATVGLPVTVTTNVSMKG